MTTLDAATAPKALVSATESAVVELKRLLVDEKAGVDGVRMAVKGGGCSGFSYVLDFDLEREGDNIVEQDGVKFFMDRESTIYLKRDWAKTRLRRGRRSIPRSARQNEFRWSLGTRRRKDSG
jgi:iron-sulfur cluster assembly accessory protein